jgi:hypothetical protein
MDVFASEINWVAGAGVPVDFGSASSVVVVLTASDDFRDSSLGSAVLLEGSICELSEELDTVLVSI